MLIIWDDHDIIARRAYELWDQDGRPTASADRYWYRAESELAATHFSLPALRRRLRRLFRQNDRKPPTPSPAQTGDAASSLAVTFQAYVVIVGALLYFTGWIFWYHYLNRFGIDILSLDIPLYYVFVYSFSVVRYVLFERHILSVSIIAVLLALIYLSTRYRMFSRPLIILTVLFSFFVSHVCAFEAAESSAALLQSNPESIVELAFLNPEKLSSDPYFDAVKSFDPRNGGAIPVLQTHEFFFVWVQPVSPNGTRLSKLLQIRNSEILFAKIREP